MHRLAREVLTGQPFQALHQIAALAPEGAQDVPDRPLVIAGLVGGAIALTLDRRHAEYVRQQLACGGLRLWVQTVDRDRETPACHILKRRAARAVHVQEAVHTGRIFSTA